MTLKRTPLYQDHLNLGAKMVDFGGWEMPVQYSGVIAEHLAVRNAAGLFDASHMGQFFIRGEGAESFVNELVTNDVTTLVDFQAQYTAMCNEAGGIIDDLIVYRFNPKHFMLVVNASNIEKDFNHVVRLHEQWKSSGKPTIQISNESNKYALIALQGPKSPEILKTAFGINTESLKNYHFLQTQILASECIVARTGYTGEDGFELICLAEKASLIWNALIKAGESFGILPCGLGSRDTLRLEKKFALYGNELSETTSPLETGLAWVTKLNKKHFIGKEALVKQKELGILRALVGFKTLGRGIPRHGYQVFNDHEPIGEVTSGTHSPCLKAAIGVALVRKDFSAIGTKLKVKIREEFCEVEVVKTPFV